MKNTHSSFDEHTLLHHLKHYLPAQAPLKDFIHHNTLHAFQDKVFHEALLQANQIFGYKAYLTLNEYRKRYQAAEIKDTILDKVITDRKGAENLSLWRQKLLQQSYIAEDVARIGALRSNWRDLYHLDLDGLVHPFLFRLLCSYLDQGISIWNFPLWQKGFLASLREMERNTFSSLFKTKRARQLLADESLNMETLLAILVGDESLYEQYVMDQQFAHQGWSGMVSAVETLPETLLDTRKITLKELIIFELLLEIDAIDAALGVNWKPLATQVSEKPTPIFADLAYSERLEVLSIWQDAFEWEYHNTVLNALLLGRKTEESSPKKSFQAAFCIDDRECSLRRYVEQADKRSETFGTPGFFNVAFYYQPEGGKFHTKLCPAPVTPSHLIKEQDNTMKLEKDIHFTKNSHSLLYGWFISQTLGFWSAAKLFWNIFRPSMSPATASSLRHMDKFASLTIEHKGEFEGNLQVGFTLEEMADRVEGLLKSIGLVKDFAPLVYIVGHGSSSVNNPHFSAYDCGACSGRAGSVNARVISFMANHPKVREILATRGLVIPAETQFVGCLHDTTRDDMVFYDEESLSIANKAHHTQNEFVFAQALDLNAKERSRRFESIETGTSAARIHEKIQERSVSLFEPRPELNHATNAVCIVGRRGLSQNVFLDRRSFLNSYNYQIDPEGNFLFNILKAAAPVCGGINLEYYFSRVDNQKLGAGSKLPHNVMGLFGVANGIDGDLRPGLPSQMIEVHDPVRLMIVVEHFPEVVLNVIQRNAETYEWFINEWVKLVVAHPEKNELYHFEKGAFARYAPILTEIKTAVSVESLIESYTGNIPVHILSTAKHG